MATRKWPMIIICFLILQRLNIKTFLTAVPRSPPNTRAEGQGPHGVPRDLLNPASPPHEQETVGKPDRQQQRNPLLIEADLLARQRG